MARGDNISDHYVAVAGNTTVAIQPASGDEWMITFLCDDEDGGGRQVYLYGYDGTNRFAINCAPHGANTATAVDMARGVDGWEVTNIAITEDEYLQFSSVNAAASTCVFSGIKIKD